MPTSASLPASFSSAFKLSDTVYLVGVRGGGGVPSSDCNWGHVMKGPLTGVPNVACRI